MPEERERPRPHGDPLEKAVDKSPEPNRGQSESATPKKAPREGDPDIRELADRAVSGVRIVSETD
jgi:hypothetical protein